MASYRHLKEISSETVAQDEKRTYTKKEKMGNWWHYHWKIVAVVLAGVLLAGWGIVDVVTKQEPDMVIGIISVGFSDELAEQIARQFEEMVPDINGDGKVLVSVDVFTVAVTEEALEAADPNMQMAGITRFTVALSEGSPMIYIVPTANADAIQEGYALFGTLQGKAANGSTQPLTLGWQDSAQLSAMDLGIAMQDGTTVDGQLIMRNYCIGIRSYEESALSKEKNGEEMWQHTISLFNKITA